MTLSKNTNVLIVGLGLIGGSYAKALIKKGHSVSAIDSRPEAIDYAIKEHIIDKGAAIPDPALISETHCQGGDIFDGMIVNVINVISFRKITDKGILIKFQELNED